MNKLQLLDKVSKDTSLTKADCSKVLNAWVATVKKSIKKGEDVKIVGFGTFTKIKRKPRAGVNPQTKQPIKIPGCWAPKFRAGNEFKAGM